VFIQKPLLKEIAVLSIIIAVFHYLCLVLFLYWTVWWSDIVMHFLGGLIIGLISIFIFYTSGLINLKKENTLIVFITTIGFVLIVGMSWELWEIFAGLTSILKDQTDTIIDLIMDIVGALASIFYFKNKTWIQN